MNRCLAHSGHDWWWQDSQAAGKVTWINHFHCAKGKTVHPPYSCPPSLPTTDVAPFRQRKAHLASSLNKCQRTRPRRQNPNHHPSHHPSNSSSGLTKLIVIPKSTWAWVGGRGCSGMSQRSQNLLVSGSLEWHRSKELPCSDDANVNSVFLWQVGPTSYQTLKRHIQPTDKPLLTYMCS